MGRFISLGNYNVQQQMVRYIYKSGDMAHLSVKSRDVFTAGLILEAFVNDEKKWRREYENKLKQQQQHIYGACTEKKH